MVKPTFEVVEVEVGTGATPVKVQLRGRWYAEDRHLDIDSLNVIDSTIDLWPWLQDTDAGILCALKAEMRLAGTDPKMLSKLVNWDAVVEAAGVEAQLKKVLS